MPVVEVEVETVRPPPPRRRLLLLLLLLILLLLLLLLPLLLPQLLLLVLQYCYCCRYCCCRFSSGALSPAPRAAAAAATFCFALHAQPLESDLCVKPAMPLHRLFKGARMARKNIATEAGNRNKESCNDFL